MSSNLIGKELKRLRKALKLTQQEICEGICDQSMLSKIEKGITYPSANLLYGLAERLNVDVEHFFRYANVPNVAKIKELRFSLREAVRRKDYKKVKLIVENDDNNEIISSDKETNQLLLWHKGMIHYYCDNLPEKAISTLKKALSINGNRRYCDMFSEQELEILNTIGVIYSEEEDYKRAYTIFNDCKEALEDRFVIKEKTIYIKVLFNISKVLTKMEKYEESNQLCMLGIEQCKKFHLLYMYGEFIYHIGYNYDLQGDSNIALEYYKKSVQLFAFQDTHSYIPYIEKRIETITSIGEERIMSRVYS